MIAGTNTNARREAAWERYRDTPAMCHVLKDPEPGDVRLPFEAGYNTAALKEVGLFEALVRDWRAKTKEIREAGDAGPIMLAIADELLVRSDDLEDAFEKRRRSTGPL